MQKTVVLIWPWVNIKNDSIPLQIHDTRTPLWALALGTYLKEKVPNVKIHILDERIIDSRAIMKKINHLKPDIVGISLSYLNYEKSLMFAKRAKSLNAKVVFGGGYATIFRKEIFKNRGPYSNDYCVDIIIQRDGEKAFYEYILKKPLDKIKNLVYQDETGIKENFVELLNLSSLPIPDRDLLDVEEYFNLDRIFFNKQEKQKLRCLNVYPHRGCWWRDKTGGCLFCSNLEKPLRLRNVKILAKEIDILISKYNTDHIVIEAEDFLGDIQWFKDFARAYRPYLDKYISRETLPFLRISTRADRITAETIKILKGINVSRVFIGFESGDQERLMAINKGISLKAIMRAANSLNEHKIGIAAGFILGLPGETMETLQKTLYLIKKMSLLNYVGVIYLQTLTPLPSSPAWEMLIKKTGKTYRNKDIIDWNRVRKDWIKHFCNLGRQDIIEAKEEFRRLGRQQSKIHFVLFDEIKF